MKPFVRSVSMYAMKTKSQSYDRLEIRAYGIMNHG
jgi:hypothetical protein